MSWLLDTCVVSEAMRKQPSSRVVGWLARQAILSGYPFFPATVGGLPVDWRVPASVVREGKVPSAYFLEQAGAKGMLRGGVRVAGYHANLIYNEGGGTALDVRQLIAELKRRVREQCGVNLEEEVQYV